MALDFKTFLAANVLNDGSIVSYRSLSREMKVHNNLAKQMLYDFYHHQTSKKPGSVHATYLLSGIINPANSPSNGNHRDEDEEDAHMQSSPFVSSQLRPEEDTAIALPVTLITLVREEELEEAKARYDQISSVHIYSLGPSTIKNLQTLSDCNRAIAKKFATEDPLIYGKQYGVVQNSQVKRRPGRRPVVSGAPEVAVKPPNPSESSQGPGKPVSKNAKASSQDSSRAEIKPKVKTEDSKSSDKKINSKPPATKREHSDIFKSFSKPRAKLSRESTSSSTGAPAPAATPTLEQDDSSVQEDEPMKDASEDEQEEDFIPKSTKNADPKKSKAERAEQLRKMMEQDEDEMDTGGEDPTAASQDSTTPLDAPSAQADPSPEPPAVVTGGRRRGRRKVMKKKTTKDGEGYLVTKEEPAWESFSEDEPAQQKEKTPASTASSMGKGKKSGGKVGQGNIMSFFGKK